ncbi:MAG: TerC/Alx family metal homeostasis membrane protein [Phycisphaerales bacterium]|nr:TerC/Alx family metal homeostasis membrane protein [Phycisphaerales bacterium]
MAAPCRGDAAHTATYSPAHGPAMTLIYITFLSLLGVLLAIDLIFLNRGSHVIGVAKALRQTGFWFLVAMAFNVGVYLLYDHHVAGLGGPAPAIASEPVQPPVASAGKGALHDALMPENGREAAVMFFQGYLLEFMLSLDNMMVIAIIINYFRVPAKYQHRVLFWGIIGAVALRGALIGLGVAIVSKFLWVLYLFGAFLVWTALKLWRAGDEEPPDFEQNLIVRAARAIFRVTPDYDGERFFSRLDGKLAITPMLLALLVVDVADVVFAVDSIPAIFGTTLDPFLVLTSNCFAILGLRSLYFAVAALTRSFRYLKLAIILILGFIGVKMLLPALDLIPGIQKAGIDFHLSPLLSLGIIAAIMLVGIVASIVNPTKAEAEQEGSGNATDSTRADNDRRNGS